MGSRVPEIDDPEIDDPKTDAGTADATPEDVAALYSWAKLQGAKYRDYSGSRREYRAQVRYRAAKAQLDREVRAQAEAEAAAAEAERAAAAAEALARGASGDQSEVWRAQSVVAAEQAARRAAEGRVEVARRAEFSARLAVVALREEREIAEAHASAKRQAMLYEGAEIRLRQLAGPQPRGALFGEDVSLDEEDREIDFAGADGLEQISFPGWEDFAVAGAAEMAGGEAETRAEQRAASASFESYPAWDDLAGDAGLEEENTPAWLFSAEGGARPEASGQSAWVQRPEAPAGDTLFDSREQVAARWFALKGVFDDARHDVGAMAPARPRGVSAPLVALFSLAGGVGKTSLAAVLARRLAAKGENVVLTDTTAQGLLPIYFGLHELRPGCAHNVELAGKTGKGTISLVIPRAGGTNGEAGQRERLVEEVLRSAAGNHRLVLDLATGADTLIRRMADRHSVVVVPITPDINSVMSLQAVERLFHGILDSQRRPLIPVYVLNQFDAALPLHLDIREVFRRRLGDRLARVAIRHSAAVGEALAEGMTVLEYAPDDPVAQDYMDVSEWIESIAPAAGEERLGVRWGER